MSDANDPAAEPTTPRGIPEVLAPVQADLEQVGDAFKSILQSVSFRSRDMVDQGASFTGKRLRPALTCVAGRIAGGEMTDALATVAAVVELIHTATLVHDDILDGAVVRRKAATLNARWGEQMAVLVGDVLFSKAYHAAAHLEDRYASQYLSEIVGEVLEGEIHQDVMAHNAELSEDEYYKIIRGKTAALYEAALRVGAHYGGGDEGLKTALGDYGHHLGMAFQIVDDRLDVTGDEATVGKSLGRDLGEGKTTLPVIYWLAGVEGRERETAIALIERAWNDEDAARAVGRALRESGALEKADEAAQSHIDRALSALADVPMGAQRQLLETVARFVLSRAS